MTTPETQLRRLQDREELRALIGRYAIAIDTRDYATVAQCFTRDGAFGRIGAPLTSGRDAVVALFRELHSTAGPSLHANHDSVVTWSDDPDSASGIVVCHAETSDAQGMKIAAIRYHDRYAREDDQWRFAARQLEMVYQVPVSDYAGAMRSAE